MPAPSRQAAWAQASLSDQQGIGQSEPEAFTPLTKARKKAKQSGLATPRHRLALVGTAASCAAMAVGAGAAMTALALDARQVAVAGAALAAGNCPNILAVCIAASLLQDVSHDRSSHSDICCHLLPCSLQQQGCTCRQHAVAACLQYTLTAAEADTTPPAACTTAKEHAPCLSDMQFMSLHTLLPR